MSTVLFPARSRCATCRKKLTKENVLSAQYCSLKCGKLSPPISKIDDAPRGCKRQVNGKWSYKTGYSDPSAVPNKYKNDPSSNIYECDNCHKFHIGHNRPDTSHDPFRDNISTVVLGSESMGETIRKYREALGVDKRDLAKTLKIPTVRITELEAGDRNTSVKVMFAVLDALRMKVNIIARAPRL